MKFYLIDDDASVCNILKIIIQQKKLGEVCGSASNGVDALEDLRFIHPDIIIVDLLMPIMDGINFVRKAKEQYPDICYVMLSQVSSKEMVAQAYECGVTFFLQKPVNGVEVVRVLTNVCGLHPDEAHLPADAVAVYAGRAGKYGCCTGAGAQAVVRAAGG